MEWSQRRPEYVRFLSTSGQESHKKRVLPAGTPCFVAIGATIGKVAQPDRRVLSNQQIHGVIARPDLASPNFVYYLLRNSSKKIATSVTGSTMPIINKTDFSNLRFDFPPLEEQERIAGVLGAFDDLIETNRRLMMQIREVVRSAWVRALSALPNRGWVGDGAG